RPRAPTPRAWTLAPFLRAQLARGENEFLFVPFFISAQGAIGSALRGELEKLQQQLGGFSFVFTTGLAASGALGHIVAARVRETIASKTLQRPAVIVVDHGGPSAASAALRDAVAKEAGRSLLAGDFRGTGLLTRESGHGSGDPCHSRSLACKQAPTLIGSIAAASLEGVHPPLLADELARSEYAGRDVVIALLFLAPGRHAGANGDVAQICRASPARCHLTALVGDHPATTEVLAQALRAALPTEAGADVR
ncbi:MAG: hypothetical protein HZA93_22455, partial [Verrucomicrobia bacterium]|nr:hypothetical protein [Verrucomicrobiota bacterium]